MGPFNGIPGTCSTNPIEMIAYSGHVFTQYNTCGSRVVKVQMITCSGDWYAQVCLGAQAAYFCTNVPSIQVFVSAIVNQGPSSVYCIPGGLVTTNIVSSTE